ncbi:MAG TPA: PTS sugar transporter subunit IIB [Gemmatimonadales bacterium]|jgi:PTS system mannose-specific IIB component/fructoselysine and glucoselysine-specific PTS system IIB component|nr:PTS sugar transporter subunit IIB [Gemmatimonadales bacterium]
MPIVLCRVDDRLVHGQVVVGWGRPLDLRRIVLVDEEVWANPWEQELYRMAAPPEIAVEFASPAEAAGRLAAWEAGRERVLVLVGAIATAVELLRCAPAGLRRLNLGGIHAGPGRRERLRYLYLSDEEIGMLEGMARKGVEISAQDLPTSRVVPLKELV